MRAVNLLPPDQRGRGPAKGGATPAYLLVACLALVLAGVLAFALFDKRVSERTTELANLEGEAAVAQANVASLIPYTDFQLVRDARVATIDALARSRFDWERVMRELARVIPKGITLSNVTGTVAPAVEVEGDAAVGLRESVEGPAIELVGCGESQRDLARLVASINDIDGVTRVTAANGVREERAPAGTAEADASGDTGCGPNAAAFELVAAFDAIAVPVGSEASIAPAAPAAGAAGAAGDPAAGGAGPVSAPQAEAAPEGEQTTPTDTANATNTQRGG